MILLTLGLCGIATSDRPTIPPCMTHECMLNIVGVMLYRGRAEVLGPKLNYCHTFYLKTHDTEKSESESATLWWEAGDKPSELRYGLSNRMEYLCRLNKSAQKFWVFHRGVTENFVARQVTLRPWKTDSHCIKGMCRLHHQQLEVLLQGL
jgi:hypothetical protein